MEALDWITIEGFKSIRRIENLELRPVNVLIGPNGSGKSNFINAFSFLHAVRGGRLNHYVNRAGGAEQILHFGSKITSELVIHISFANEKNQYRIELAVDDADNLFPASETAFSWKKDKYDRPYHQPLSGSNREAGISKRNLEPDVPSYVAERLDSWRLYHFHDTSSTSPMKKKTDVNDNRYLRQDASNLASFLYYLQETHEDSYDLIRRTTRLVAPFFEDFLLEPMELSENNILLEWRHRKSDAYFGPSSLSDGTLRFIALATLLLQPESLRPSVILMDEPEIGLHPYAITILASLIKQASIETQILVATQSSLFLDHFQPEDILVANRIEGGTELIRLEEEVLKDWLEDYSLGQLWEKNEFGGRPTPE